MRALPWAGQCYSVAVLKAADVNHTNYIPSRPTKGVLYFAAHDGENERYSPKKGKSL